MRLFLRQTAEPTDISATDTVPSPRVAPQPVVSSAAAVVSATTSADVLSATVTVVVVAAVLGGAVVLAAVVVSDVEVAEFDELDELDELDEGAWRFRAERLCTSLAFNALLNIIMSSKDISIEPSCFCPNTMSPLIFIVW